jgi:hypothetical protein
VVEFRCRLGVCDSTVHVGYALVHMCAKCGSINDARVVFDKFGMVMKHIDYLLKLYEKPSEHIEKQKLIGLYYLCMILDAFL